VTLTISKVVTCLGDDSGWDTNRSDNDGSKNIRQRKRRQQRTTSTTRLKTEAELAYDYSTCMKCTCRPEEKKSLYNGECYLGSSHTIPICKECLDEFVDLGEKILVDSCKAEFSSCWKRYERENNILGSKTTKAEQLVKNMKFDQYLKDRKDELQANTDLLDERINKVWPAQRAAKAAGELALQIFYEANDAARKAAVPAEKAKKAAAAKKWDDAIKAGEKAIASKKDN